jgi:hypothetical protein
MIIKVKYSGIVMSDKTMHGPLVNRQTPPVNSDDIICRGYYIQQDPSGKNVYSSDDKYIGAFEDATWGYGASGQVVIGNHFLGLQNNEKMQEIRSARKKLEG